MRYQALIVAGDHAGKVVPGGPDRLATLAVAQMPPGRIFQAGEVGLEKWDRPVPVERFYYERMGWLLPYGYYAYIPSGAKATQSHWETAVRMVELLVKEGHAKDVEGLWKRIELLEERHASLARKVSGMVANHELSTSLDDMSWCSDCDEYESVINEEGESK